MLQEERERNTESLELRAGSWSPYPWTITDSLWKASWLSPPQTLAASMHADLVLQREAIRRVRVCACTCVMFVCCMHAGGRACVRGQGNYVTARAGEGNSAMSVYLPLQSQSLQLYNLLTAARKSIADKLLKGSSRPGRGELSPHARNQKKKNRNEKREREKNVKTNRKLN